jgi:small redox-active disulfide protein 2
VKIVAMDRRIAQLRVGRVTVGIPGLDEILKEVRGLGLTDNEAVGTELLRRVRERCYVARGAEDAYRDALIREYQRSLGEPVEDETGFKVIRVLGPGCPRCGELMKRVLSVLQEESIEADVQHVRDVKEIASYGVLGTPCLVINEKVVSSGRLPSTGDLKKLLKGE